jgi:hypothetical protein
MAGADSADPTESDASPVDGARKEPAGGGVTGRKFFTKVGPRSGPIFCREDYDTIDVLGDRDDDTPIGTARPVGCTEGWITIWEISLAHAKVAGRWIVLGREFLPKK